VQVKGQQNQLPTVHLNNNIKQMKFSDQSRDCSRERSSPVMQSAAKHLAAARDRPSRSLHWAERMCSGWQGV